MNMIRRIKRTMAQEVERTHDTLTVIEDSSNTNKDTLEKHESIGGHIHESKDLVSKVQRKIFIEQLKLYGALAYFFICVLYVVYCRI